MQKYDVLVIGAGPAGLFAACNIKNLYTALIEKNDRAGRKLLITGGGRCNITHKEDAVKMLSHYSKGRFLKPALYNFDSDRLIKYMSDNGLRLDVQIDGRVFPHSDKAKDVVDFLANKCTFNKVNMITEEKVENIRKIGDIFIVRTDKTMYTSKCVVLATGGKSCPNTGSTGDGYIFAEKLGHTIVKPTPALTPLKIKSFDMSDLTGLSFDIPFDHYRDGHKIKSYKGEILLTHGGLSGPAVLNMSGYARRGDVIKINFTNSSKETFERYLLDKTENYGRQKVKNVLKENLTNRLVDFIFDKLNISDVYCSELKKEQRKKLIEMLTEYEFVIEDKADFNMAMVTRGGVETSEINPKTMESKKVPNLYFAGEIIDADGDTGGYNIHAALAEAFIASQDINRKSNELRLG